MVPKLEELQKKAKGMLIQFCNEIGLDGEALYGESLECDCIPTRMVDTVVGKYYAPGEVSLEKMKQLGLSEEQIERANEIGIIFVNEKTVNNPEETIEVLDTLVHEMIHSKRNLLIYDYYRAANGEDEYQHFNEQAYTFQQPPKRREQKGKVLDQLYTTTDEMRDSYADASQEIIKGKIHRDDELMKDVYQMSTKEAIDLDFEEGRVSLKIAKQHEIDEALVHIMADLATYIEVNKKRVSNIDIWEIIDKLEKRDHNSTVGAMCRIIQRHHDFELFHWMIDPIGYSEGDIHYDFFNRYTKDDQDLLETFFHDSEMTDGSMSYEEFGRRSDKEMVKRVKDVDGDENAIPPKKPSLELDDK